MASAPSARQRGGATAPDKVLCFRLPPASDAEKQPKNHHGNAFHGLGFSTSVLFVVKRNKNCAAQKNQAHLTHCKYAYFCSKIVIISEYLGYYFFTPGHFIRHPRRLAILAALAGGHPQKRIFAYAPPAMRAARCSANMTGAAGPRVAASAHFSIMVRRVSRWSRRA